MKFQKTIKIKHKSGGHTKITIKKYASGDFGIFRKYSYKETEDSNFISPEEFTEMMRLQTKYMGDANRGKDE